MLNHSPYSCCDYYRGLSTVVLSPSTTRCSIQINFGRCTCKPNMISLSPSTDVSRFWRIWREGRIWQTKMSPAEGKTLSRTHKGFTYLFCSCRVALKKVGLHKTGCHMTVMWWCLSKLWQVIECYFKTHHLIVDHTKHQHRIVYHTALYNLLQIVNYSALWYTNLNEQSQCLVNVHTVS